MKSYDVEFSCFARIEAKNASEAKSIFTKMIKDAKVKEIYDHIRWWENKND